MEVQVYKDKGNEWRWRKVAANGRIVAESGEGYTRYVDALEAADKFADGEPVRGPDETYRHEAKPE